MHLLNKNLLVLLIAVSVFSTACGKKKDSEPVKAESQVVAKVNGDEILIHQVNFQLARLGQLNEAQSKLAAKQILSKLVEQQLLKKQAIETKLDRDPTVLLAIEASKDEILSQAYLEQLMLKANKPSASEIDTFYKSHPELFENRHVFRLQELVIEVNKDKFAEVQNNLKAIKGINEIATWLKNNNYPFSANSNVRAAEQLPLDMLKKLQLLKEGEFLIVPTDRSLNVVHLAAIQSAPISREKAIPIIEQYFINQNKSTLAKNEILALNEKAKIEFLGAFSDMKKQELLKPSIAEANKELPKKASESDVEPTLSDAKENQPVAKPKGDQANMDKGLSGL
jgi:EpsD family peptidyl-prolyl cis-trans isomerase